MKIALAADHGGYELKNIIIKYLKNLNYECIDFGINENESVDYPDYAHPVCESITKGETDFGILVCGTGIGMSMSANKHHGIRAACCSDTYSAKLTRMHNDANVLCLGGRVVGEGLALDIVKLFVETEFEGGRHSKRVEKIMKFDLM